MGRSSSAMTDMVTTLVPMLSRSLEEQFNLFRVMRHGTHEKQLSNVLAWLLDPGATHGLDKVAQRLFLERVNTQLPIEAQLPITGYRVAQEVNSDASEDGADARFAELGKDIADIVLTSDHSAVVVENFSTSDGHGHSFHRYYAHGTAGGRTSVVVLLCARHDPSLLRDGWERAVVVTYAEFLSDLRAHTDQAVRWRSAHPEQRFFLRQLYAHFLEGTTAVDTHDRIAFMRAMCETGESARYGYRPHDAAAQEFAALVADHAQRQFEDGRALLSDVKAALRTFARATLIGQVNEVIEQGRVQKVDTRFVGKWEWCVELIRSDSQPTIFLEFGPTAVVENERLADPLPSPNYAEIFVTRGTVGGIDQMRPSGVEFADVLGGLRSGDHRLRDAVLAVIG